MNSIEEDPLGATDSKESQLIKVVASLLDQQQGPATSRKLSEHGIYLTLLLDQLNAY